MKRADEARDSACDTSRDPWRVPINVAQIPSDGLHREIEADERARAAMAEAAGLRDISSAQAVFDLSHRSGGRVHVAGRVQARVGQTCVVTLEPIESEIDVEVDLIFEATDEAALQIEAENDDGESAMPEPPEPIENGAIDLGRLATDVLYLAIDPYPRKEGAQFEPHIRAVDPEDHPFAALKALQTAPEKPVPSSGKPKGK